MFVYGCGFSLTEPKLVNVLESTNQRTYTLLTPGPVCLCVAIAFQVVLGTTGYFFGWLGGYLYDNFPHGSFIYYGMVCGYVVLIMLILMQVFASCCAHNQDEEIVEEDVISYCDNCFVNQNTERTRL